MSRFPAVSIAFLVLLFLAAADPAPAQEKQRPPPKRTKEFTRFKDFLRRIVAVPKKEADDSAEKYREREEDKEPEGA